MLVPSLLGVVLFDSSQRRLALTTFLLGVFYLPIVGVGTSPRGVAPLLPLTMLCTVILLDHVCAKWLGRLLGLRVAGATVLILATALLAKPWLQANRAFVDGAIAGYEWRRVVETELRSQGVASPLQVFADAGFHFVTNRGAGWYSYIPRFNGGWPQIDLYGLHDKLPEMATTSLDAFVADCERGGVTHIVLSGTAGHLLPALGEIFTARRSDARLTLTAERAGLRIYRLTP